MSQPVVLCASAEPILPRVLRLIGIAMLVGCGGVLTVVTRPVIDLVTVGTYFHLASFIAALGVLVSSVAAFWWRDAALRRVEWAAYVGLGLLVAQVAARHSSGPSETVALVFGLFVATIVLARVTRPRAAAACNCG